MKPGPARDLSPTPRVEELTSRGKYDRTASPSERARRQRSQLLNTVRRLSSNGTLPTVTQVVNTTGTGRNTFYQHFRGTAEALAAAVETDRERLAAYLGPMSRDEASLTPGEHAERLAEAWVRFCEETPEGFALLDAHAPAVLEALLGQAIRQTHRAFVHAGYAPAEIADAFMVAVVGALRAVGAGIASKLRSTHSTAGVVGPNTAVPAVQQVLLRMLR